MLQLAELLGSLARFIRELIWPVFIVAEPNRAIRYTNGKPTPLPRPWLTPGPVLDPDWYIAIPFFQEIRLTNCAEDCVDVANLPITTRDEVAATVSYNLRYRITDVLKYQLNLHQSAKQDPQDDAPSAIHAEAACEVALRMRRRSWNRIYRSQGAIERRITKTMAERLENWGIHVIHGGMTICTKARPISLIHVN